MKPYHLNGIILKTNYLKLDYNLELKEKARALIKARNLPEVLFWMQVNKGRFHGLDFDRQRIIGNYIVDFYVKALGLVIEIDGTSHEGKEDLNDKREKWLINQGCRVIRFTSTQARYHMGQILSDLEGYVLKYYSL